MKTLLWLCFMVLSVISLHAADMDAAQIKNLVQKVEDALPRGSIYEIDYTVSRTKTDFYYDRRRQIIKVLEDNRSEAIKNTTCTASNGQPVPPEEAYEGLLTTFRRELTQTPESQSFTQYSTDGIGFYVKQSRAWPQSTKAVKKDGPTFYVSDGKIMGTFYADSQAVLQPATERPQMLESSWNDIAYLLDGEKLSSAVNEMNDFNMTRGNGELVIEGNLRQEARKLSQLELRLDQSTLSPLQIVILNFDKLGKLRDRYVKTWDYADFSGVRLPQKVVDQTYETDPTGRSALSQQQIFTINSFSPLPLNSKAELEALLKQNFSIYDAITGSHYLSGSPGDILDKLSK